MQIAQDVYTRLRAYAWLAEPASTRGTSTHVEGEWLTALFKKDAE